MITRTALTKAKRGAAFLDAKLGRGWRRKVRRRDLNMESGLYAYKGDCGCILAQLYHTYDEGAAALGIDNDRAERLGFLDLEAESYPELTEAWREVLRGKA